MHKEALKHEIYTAYIWTQLQAAAPEIARELKREKDLEIPRISVTFPLFFKLSKAGKVADSRKGHLAAKKLTKMIMRRTSGNQADYIELAKKAALADMPTAK